MMANKFALLFITICLVQCCVCQPTRLSRLDQLREFLNLRSGRATEQQTDEVPKVEQAPVSQEQVKEDAEIKQQEIAQQEQSTPITLPEQMKEEPVKQIEHTNTVVTGTTSDSVEEHRGTSEAGCVNGGTSTGAGGAIVGAGGVGCIKHKPNYSKAIAIAVKGNAVAAAATAGLAAPVVIKSAKVAALAGLLPVKLAAKGAILGTLIAKPIIIKSALVGATAVKLSHLLVGKPIAIGANLLAGAEALKAKLKAKKLNKKGCAGGVGAVGGAVGSAGGCSSAATAVAA